MRRSHHDYQFVISRWIGISSRIYVRDIDYNCSKQLMKYLIIGYGHGMTHWIANYPSLEEAEEELLNLPAIEGVTYEIERRE